MIDVRFVIAHGLWILGASMVLSAFSLYEWMARTEGRSLHDVLRNERGWHLSAAAGLLLVASGFLLMESTGWWIGCGWFAVWVGAGHGLWRMRARS